MSLIFPEKIYAQMTRIVDDESQNVLLVRNKTKIKFGEDNRVIGKVIMTNPGSFVILGACHLPNYIEICRMECILDRNI